MMEWLLAQGRILGDGRGGGMWEVMEQLIELVVVVAGGGWGYLHAAAGNLGPGRWSGAAAEHPAGMSDIITTMGCCEQRASTRKARVESRRSSCKVVLRQVLRLAMRGRLGIMTSADHTMSSRASAHVLAAEIARTMHLDETS